MSDMTIQNAIHCMKAMICEEVCEECDYYGKTGTDHCEADAVRMAIKALEEQPHWIPCSERLPEVKPFRTEDADYEISEAVLVTRDSWQDTKIEIGFWEVDDPDRKYWVDEYGDVLCGVVAWMPLPKPYGGESDET